ncbi:uncharacterized protein LOC134537676 isoform X2 [Bacillus rossius redtenbacheri]|uniref:uncharacterized protein LOC134537676 isoform X2 n=1 Tax=Bacillus rossius redtenbacheri TaxID=93214 RepID=UPI002FDC915A
MESDQMFGSLSSRGKLVLEAVWKDWLAMYGSQTSESDHHGKMSEQGSLLDELFPLPVTLEDSKQRAATRAQEHLENSTKATKVFSQNNYSKPPHTSNANTNSVNLQACECIQTPAKEPNDSPCKGTTNCTSKSAQSRCIEESEVTFSSVFDESNFNDDFPYKHKYGMLKSNSPSHQTEEVYEASDGGMKSLNNKNSNESFTSLQERTETPPSGLPPPTATDTEENSKSENAELYPQNLIDLTDVSKTISNDMHDENVMTSFKCLEQPADEGCVFKKPEIPLSKNKFGNQDRDCGLDWFYESHTAFNIKWAIRNECSLFSNLLGSASSVNSDFFENRFSANSIDKLMCNMYNDVESDAENVPEPLENFEISIDNDSVPEKIKSDVLGDAVLKRNVNTNDNSLIAASSQEFSSEEFEDESPSSEFFHTVQNASPKSVQSLQPPKCIKELVQHCGENKIQELCTKQCLKQRNNTELKFPERKAKSFNKRKFFKSPVIFQNSNVFANRNVLKNTEVLPTKIETGFCGFPVTSHDDMLFSGEDEVLQTKSQQENPIKQNTTFRIFKTKSFPQKNVENFVSKSSRVPMKLKQQKLDSFNFKIISNKKEESNIGAQDKFRTSKKIYSSGASQVCTVDEPPVLNADIYSISETDNEKSVLKLPLKAKMNSNVSARKKIRFQQPTKLSFEKDSFLQETLKETDEIKFIFFTLTKELFEKVLNDLKQNIVQEICLAIVYREGFCQLNKPLEHTMSTICNPKGIMFGVMDTNCDIKYYYFDVCSPSQMDESRDFILKLLNSQCRMICFEAQEMFAFLIDKFQFSPRQACIEWLMIDPLIGCWLLDPDHPVSSFRETLERLEVSTTVNDKIFQKTDASADNDLNRCCHLLQTLSTVAEKLYERLSSQHLWELFTGVELKLVPLLAGPSKATAECCSQSSWQTVLIDFPKAAEGHIV